MVEKENPLSRLISSSNLFTAWTKPDLGDDVKKKKWENISVESPVDYQIELERQAAEIKDSARLQGYKEGHIEGLEQARQEIEICVQKLKVLMDALASPLEQLADDIEDELVKLSIAIAKQIVRRELKTEPGQVIGVVKEALSALPAAGQNIKLHLHPEDAKLIEETMLVNANEGKWVVIDNPVIQRGGCRIETESSNVDATIESRVAAIAARIMGGERTNDS